MKLLKMIGLSVCAISLLITVPDTDAGMGWGRGGGKGGGQNCMSAVIASTPYQSLDENEINGLILMREEEKLARDVYIKLHELYGTPIFANISGSEQRHMDAVKVLLDKYGVADPVTDMTVGVFTSPEIQELYHSLVEQGGYSLIDALYVGATIEDLDIKDLYELLGQTDNADIKTVYQNLAKGSRNHLRAFVSQLSARGVTYQAQYLTVAMVDEIVNSPHERGFIDENMQLVTGGGRGPRGGWRE